ncbi:TetR/AcrR family transcriptional regulator [Pedobacter panaciterrae]
MATPRKNHKVRDAEATKRRLIEVVGLILQEQGHHALRTNNIARFVGRNKNVIRHHFLGLNNLKRKYISEKDYWMPFFERFQVSDSATATELKEMFVQLMQENLRFFFGDREMQKIILWQISDEDVLIRNISDEREAEGEKLFRLTDKFFSGTDVNFRAVIGLLLGGSYYMVLQANSIKSKVSGIDINDHRGMEEVNRTIAQVISWAWKAAQATQTQEVKTSSIMNHEFENLKRLATERVAGEIDAPGPESRAALYEEVKRVERIMLDHLLGLSNETQIKTYLKISMFTLVRVCDQLYRHGDLLNEDANLLMELMDAIRMPVAEYVPESIVLPKLFVNNEGLRLKEKWNHVLAEFRRSGIDHTLLEIVGIPFKRFLYSMLKMHWADFKYLRKYIAVLEELAAEGSVSEEELVHDLIGLGFNHVRFISWYVLQVQRQIAGKDVDESERILKRHKTVLRQVSLFTNMSFNAAKMHPVDELLKWIEAELVLQSELKCGADLNPLSLNCKLAGVQLAWWQKLQQKHGVYDEGDEVRLFKKVAFNFKAAGRKHLIEEDFKLDPVEIEDIAPLEPILTGMLDELRSLIQ